MSRTAVAILSTENLLHNLRVLKQHVHPAKMIAMVKANAYGHGIRSVSQRLDGHVDMLGVASIDEALALRKAGVKAAILLVEGVFEANELLIASTENFQVVFHNEKQMEWLSKCTLPRPLHAWLKINTGMGRLGFSVDAAVAAYTALLNHKYIAKPVRVMSHFGCADEKDHVFNQKQKDAFNHFLDITSHETACLNANQERSFCNSAALFNFPECHYDFVRPGIALYGVSPIQGVSAAELGLKPVMTLQTSIIAIQHMQKGDSIGYGGRYICPVDMPVGIIAFGYGDGYPITAKDGTPILVNNSECPLVGRVSMDMIAVDLRNVPAHVGDTVVLWGDGLPIERVMSHTMNITYDMLTGVQHRVKFLWTQV